MTSRTKTSTRSAAPKPETAKPAAGDESAAERAQTGAAKGTKKAGVDRPVQAIGGDALAPATREPVVPPTVKRKRLSKAFPRPLDKKRRKETLVRDGFTFPEAEYATLVALKKALGEQGVAAKKSELIRAGLTLLVELSEPEVKALLARLSR